MRRDGLSKAVEPDLSLMNLCDSMSTSSSSHQFNDVRNARYRIGSTSSQLSKDNYYLSTDRQVKLQSNGRLANCTSNTGIFFQIEFIWNFNI